MTRNPYSRAMLDAILAWHRAKVEQGDVLIAGARMRMACEAWAAEEAMRALAKLAQRLQARALAANDAGPR